MKKYQLTIPSLEIVAYGDDITTLECVATGYPGIIGYELDDATTGEVIKLQKDGLDFTISDLSSFELLSVGLYYGLVTTAMQVTGLDLETARTTVSLYHVRDMLMDDKFVNTRLGYKTRCELYNILLGVCGDTRLTRAAINEDILAYALWEMEYGCSATGYAKKLLPYVADLSTGWYERYYW